MTVEQLSEVHQACPQAIALFKLGEWFDAYEFDADKLESVLGVRPMRGEDGLRRAGFPAVFLDAYLTKLVKSGHRVAICEPIID